MKPRAWSSFASPVFAPALVLASVACSDRPHDRDPLVDLLVAVCERNDRCRCAAASDDCEADAPARAAELRDHARLLGANRFDVECADRLRDLAMLTCESGGIDHDAEALQLLADADRCQWDLFHGDLAIGAPCSHPSEVISLQASDCEAGARCLESDDGPRCTAWPAREEGDLCRDIDIAGPCRADLACVPVSPSTEECRPWTAIGEPCAGPNANYCEGPPGQWCDLDAGLCRALPGPGEPCVEAPTNIHRCADGIHCDASCNYDSFCSNGICRPRGLPGRACSFDSCALGLDCEAGTCVGDQVCFLP